MKLGFTIVAIIVTIISIAECGKLSSNSIYSDELTEPKGNLPIPTKYGAVRLKNRIKGPADMGVYYINYPAASCGGLSSTQCSQSCGKLGYPVFWCYPKVCYCHYGALDNEQEDITVPTVD